MYAFKELCIFEAVLVIVLVVQMVFLTLMVLCSIVLCLPL